MMNSEQQQDWMDDLLLDEASSSPAYIDDDGFTQRVADDLPPPGLPQRTRRLILGAALALAALVALIAFTAMSNASAEVLEAAQAGSLTSALTCLLVRTGVGAASVWMGWVVVGE